MKKIKNLKHLQKEKLRLKLQQEELEGKMEFKWNEFKEGIRPVSIVKDIFNTAIDQNREELSIRNIIKNALVFGATYLVKSFADSLDEKLFADHLSKSEK